MRRRERDGRIHRRKNGGQRACDVPGLACSAEGFFTCSSAGEPAGTIKTNALAGELHWEKGPAAKKIALDLAPQSEPLFVKIECGKTIKIEVRGSVLVNIKDGKMETTLVQKYVGSKGKQKPKFYRRSPRHENIRFPRKQVHRGISNRLGRHSQTPKPTKKRSRRTGSHSLSIAPAAGSASAAGATEGVGPQWLHAPPRLGEWASARGSYIEAGRQTSTGARPRATRALSLRARPHRPAPRDSRCMARWEASAPEHEPPGVRGAHGLTTSGVLEQPHAGKAGEHLAIWPWSVTPARSPVAERIGIR